MTERSLLAGPSIAGFVLPLIYVWTRRLDFADYRMSPGTKARAGRIGTLLYAAGLWLFWRSHLDLGANWSPTLEISAQQTLITRGVYGRIRHPMYASQALMGPQALLMPNWIAGPAGLVAFLAMYLIRVPREVQMMLDRFGEAFHAYSARTGRIVPLLRG
jgi:protein-S-isoprenylcysteine O-methyltransferase Ste14